MREFSTAVRPAAESSDAETIKPVTIKIDGYTVTFRGANSGQISMALAAGHAGTMTESIAVVINLFFALLHDNPQTGATGNPKYNMDTGQPVWDVGSGARSASHFRHRLFDSNDEFGPEVISEVVRGLIEEWTGNPTQSPTGSTPGQGKTGSTSTAPTPPSTSSAFGPIASAT
jgi:hypothetical protein